MAIAAHTYVIVLHMKPLLERQHSSGIRPRTGVLRDKRSRPGSRLVGQFHDQIRCRYVSYNSSLQCRL